MERSPQDIFHSLDRSKTKEFILAHTAALSSRAFLTSGDVKTIQGVMRSGENEPFLELFDKDPSVIFYCEKIWSNERFFINHFKFSTYKIILDFSVCLREFITQLQKKSELFFNQYFEFKTSDGQFSRQLLSEFLTEFAENLALHLQTFLELSENLNRFEKSALSNHDADFSKLELELAVSLEMKAADKSIFSSNKNLIKKISQAFQTLSSDLKAAFDSFSHGLKDLKKTADFGIKLSWSQAEISVLQQIFALSEEPRDFRIREIQRIEASFNIYSATEFLKRTLTQMIASLSQTNVLVVKDGLGNMGSVFETWLTTKIVAEGQKCVNAMQGVTALQVYCSKNESTVNQLLADEFKKIHPSLTDKTFALAQASDKATFGKVAEGALKKQLLKRAQVLSKFLAGIFLLVFFSCGLKTPVHSNERELRPEIPYRGKTSQSVETKKTAEKTDAKK